MAQEEKQKKDKKKPNVLVIIIVIMSFIIMVGSVAMVFIATDIKISDIMARFQKHEEFVMPMDSYVVNLRTEGTKTTYLKANVSLLYTNEDHAAVLTNKTSQLRDVIIHDLMEYTPEDLLKEGGLAGAKVKIKASINAALGEDVVAEVYFTEFLVQ